MKQATKGALAAATAVALLSGGAGTLAYWTGQQDVTGGSISSGRLTLSAPVCDSVADPTTHDWQYDGGAAFSLTGSKVVPGDTITKVCKMTLDMVGDHVGADLGLSQPAFGAGGSGTLADELAPEATFTVDGDTTTSVTQPGTHTVLATVTVTFDGAGATDDSQNVSAALQDITLTATQTHDTAS